MSRRMLTCCNWTRGVGGRVSDGERGRASQPVRDDAAPAVTAGFEVPVDTTGMTAGAAAQVRALVRRFSDDLVRETARLEEGHRAVSLHDPEITSSTVLEAHDVVRRPAPTPVAPPVNPWWYALSVGAFTCGILTGVMGSYLHSTLQWVVFVVLLIASVSGTAAVTWRKL